MHRDAIILGVHALIECKRCIAGCVVFGGGLRQAAIDSHLGHMEGHGWGQPSAVLFKAGALAGTSFQETVEWSRKRWRPSEFVGTQFAKIVSHDKGATWQAKHEDLFESIDGLMHGLIDYRTEAGLVAPGVEMPFFNLAALVVVVDGPLYFYSTDRGPRTRALRRVDHASVLLRTVVRDHRLQFRVDFIQARGVAAYMSRLHRDAMAIVKSLEKHKDILNESVQRFGHTDRGENRFGG